MTSSLAVYEQQIQSSLRQKEKSTRMPIIATGQAVQGQSMDIKLKLKHIQDEKKCNMPESNCNAETEAFYQVCPESVKPLVMWLHS